ncbi:hypothetical protein [Geodermatophilus marinus]|uniref:hypothetical protein n=1 Tax=Geodermatophilus sp. LHW52908 TaxID=2303986 RepID=UPI001F29DEC3|nr:hypothetical protein [Geodermatophilus sp. LHW52908]
MASDRPDPGEFLELAQRMLRQFLGDQGSDQGSDEPWAQATRGSGRTRIPPAEREPSPERQRENLTFALGTRAVEALEDLALNVAAIRQRLERMDARAPGVRLGKDQDADQQGDGDGDGRGPEGGAAGGR